MRYVYEMTVMSVAEEKVRFNFRKDPATGQVTNDEKSTGRWSVSDGSYSFMVRGKPDIAPGDRLRTTLEKI